MNATKNLTKQNLSQIFAKRLGRDFTQILTQTFAQNLAQSIRKILDTSHYPKQALKIFLLAFVLLFSQQAHSEQNPQTLKHLDKLQHTTKIAISSVDTKSNTIEFPAMGRVVGESGFVWHIYDENYASIIATATIIEIKSSQNDTQENSPQKSGTQEKTSPKNTAQKATQNTKQNSKDDTSPAQSAKAIARINPINVLGQKYLPSPTNKPVAGDEVHFGTLNSLAFIIAPTLETYDSIRASYPSMQFLNSDLMVGYLFDKSKFDPKPKVLNNACAVYSVGLLFLVTKDKLSVLDCQSLVELDSVAFDTSAVEQSVAPFFSRVQYASSGSLDSALKRKKSKQYFEYYNELLKEGKNFK